ncbi:MAG: hypothetical protein ACKKMP_00145 [Candidatus Nealsonbacteria bacterium]
MKKFKIKLPKFLLGVPVALLSLKIFFGGVFGYLLARFLSGKIGSVVFGIGSFKFHFHHWLMGALALGLIFLYEVSPLMDQLFYGFIGGIIFQGIFNYADWHRILFKKRKL